MKISLNNMVLFATKPYGIVVITVTLSFFAWLTLGFGGIEDEYEVTQKLFSVGGLLALAWYSLIILFSWLFFQLGKLSQKLVGPFDLRTSLDDFTAYCYVSIVGFIGFVYVAQFMIFSLGINIMLLAVVSGEANTLHKTLYEDYSIGLFSLRYVVILSGGVAIYRLISKISRSVLDFGNILMLLLLAVIASRLSIVFALLIGFGLWAVNNPRIKIRIGRSIILLLTVFIILSLYNYSRNIGFYIARGNDNLITAGVVEMFRYLASPFQGSLAAGNYFEQIMANPNSAYLYTGIDPSLTTNSALLGLVAANGYMFFPIMMLSIIVSSFVMGMIYHHKDKYLILVYFVFLYCFAEIWRVYIFSAGIITTLLLLSLTAPLVSRAIKPVLSLIGSSYFYASSADTRCGRK